MIRITVIHSTEELRDLLDRLNESGVDPSVAGRDGIGPFLALLHGPYADTEEVHRISPWDREADFGTRTFCEECAAHSPLGFDHLRFPAFLLEGLR